MWTWDQSAGALYRDGKLVSRGYSGKGRGKNNPALQAMPGTGPIPTGRWRMLRVYDSDKVGPYAIVLDKVDAHPGDDKDDVTGRGAFRVHGDSVREPGSASNGCIILQRAIREMMWRSGDHDLEVVA
jgi:hypothetical protein